MKRYPEKAESLHNALFDYLEKVGARFPERDPLYDEEAERERLERIARVRMSKLEEQRLQVLSPDFDPQNDWWGSAVE